MKADEDAFKKSEEDERAMQARIRKVQEGVDNARQQSARRKMEKIEAREWDTGKGDGGQENGWGHDEKGKEGKAPSRGRGRGRGRAHGRGRGQGRGDDTAGGDLRTPTTSGAEADGKEWEVPPPEGETNQAQADWSNRPSWD